MPQPEDVDEFGDDAEDHHVPVELIVIGEVLEWQQAVADQQPVEQ